MRKSSTLIFVLALLFFPFSLFAKDLFFSNLLWHVRDGVGGPGPNNWSSNNVWVDAKGYLHLRINKVGNKWYCPELVTDKRLGFGEYWYYTIGDLTKIDRNIILGLFHYTTPDIGPDGTNEIDIEFSRWGNINYPPGGYTVWPAVPGYQFTTHKFSFVQDGTYTTHGYVWQSKQITFKSGFGHYPNYPYPITTWTFSPANYTRLIPQHAMPVHINAWLLGGKPPTNATQYEVVIAKFCYKPTVGVGNCS